MNLILADIPYGFYIGQDAALIVCPPFRAAFLRLNNQQIVTSLMADGRIFGAVSGQRRYSDASAALIDDGASRFVTRAAMLDELNACEKAFADCTADVCSDCVTLHYNGNCFKLTLADAIDPDIFNTLQPANPALTLAQKMQRWNVNCYLFCESGKVRANVSNGRYDCHWEADASSGAIYCRLGQNGYCERGWAMLSSVVLRPQECWMMADHREALRPYQPQEECFVEDGCAFPDDGGWYWSVKQVTDDCITLNGCGGDTYCIYRPR